MSDLVIFATGDMARWARVVFERDSELTPVAFTVHREYTDGEELEGLPVVPFENLTESHPPGSCSLFVASGYRGTNALRAEVCGQARGAGYRLPTLVCRNGSSYGELGDNVIVSPAAAVMPHASVGNGSIVCVGATVAHDVTVGEYTYLSSQAVLMGGCRIGDRCFIGGGAKIRDGVSVGDRSVIGAGALIMKDTEPDSVHSVRGTPPREIRSYDLDDF